MTHIEEATKIVTTSGDPFVLDCAGLGRSVQANYYEGSCVGYCTGTKKIGETKTTVYRQSICNKAACCITTTKFCTKDGVLQLPGEQTIKSAGNGLTCDAKVESCPFLPGVIWKGKSPCFASCNAPKGKAVNNGGIEDDEFMNENLLYKKVGNQILSVSVYPNPATDIVNLLFKQEFIGTVSLFGLDGRLLNTQVSSQTNLISFDVSYLTKGFYFISFKDDNGAMITEKIIVD